MAKMNGMNANYRYVGEALRTFEGGAAFAAQVVDKINAQADPKKGTPVRTFNSVNATLAAMAGKGYVTKEKGVFNDKLLTKYTLTPEGLAELDKVEAPAEDAE